MLPLFVRPGDEVTDHSWVYGAKEIGYQFTLFSKSLGKVKI